MPKINDIESMIAEENDPKQRSFLIILNSINNSLQASTDATSRLAQKFDDHLTQFDKKVQEDAEIMNQGKGAWKVAAWVLGIAQIVFIGLASYASKDLNNIHDAMHEGQLTDARIEERIKKIEEKMVAK